MTGSNTRTTSIVTTGQLTAGDVASALSFRVWSSTLRAPGSLRVEHNLGVEVNMSVAMLLEVDGGRDRLNGRGDSASSGTLTSQPPCET
jgi:hypothetical protein